MSDAKNMTGCLERAMVGGKKVDVDSVVKQMKQKVDDIRSLADALIHQKHRNDALDLLITAREDIERLCVACADKKCTGL